MKYLDDNIVGQIIDLLNIKGYERGHYDLTNDSLKVIWYWLNYYAEVRQVNVNSLYHIISVARNNRLNIHIFPKSRQAEIEKMLKLINFW